jgi:hypothetical protein
MKTKPHITPDGKFEYGWISSPAQMIGRMTPFRQCWNVQYLGDGTQDFVTTRREVFEFVRDFYDICDTPYPKWLKRELPPL